MSRLQRLRRHLMMGTALGASWLGAAASAWAQAQPSAPGGAGGAGEPPAYVGPYAMVIFSIALGLLLVLHPTRRRDRAKPETYSERGKK